MQTSIHEKFSNNQLVEEAESILRSCVHCGFCTATCPTYQTLGDELDSPRGRIYLIKQMLESGEAGRETQKHLDRCLTCRSCETTCPSGVRYARLADIGRQMLEEQAPRPLKEKLIRHALRWLVPYPSRFRAALRLGNAVRFALPAKLKEKLTPPATASWLEAPQARQMLVLPGCAQQVTRPGTNAAAAKVLRHQGIQLINADNTGCCGALSYHMSAVDEAREMARRNIDALLTGLDSGAEAIISTASGCGMMYKDYPELFREEPEYLLKAERLLAHIKDISEVVDASLLRGKLKPSASKLALHLPCTLQHGLKLGDRATRLLQDLGFELSTCAEGHLCCGSAGSYSLLQPELSQKLLKRKLDNLQSGDAEHIVTANIGCQLHLASQAKKPVSHWVELLAEHLPD